MTSPDRASSNVLRILADTIGRTAAAMQPTTSSSHWLYLTMLGTLLLAAPLMGLLGFLGAWAMPLSQILFILAPVVLFAMMGKLPVGTTVLRRNRTSVLSLLLAVGLGACWWFVAVFLDVSLRDALMGFSLIGTDAAPAAAPIVSLIKVPQPPADALVALGPDMGQVLSFFLPAAIAIIVFAPLFEEFAFRGFISQAYEKHGLATSLLVPGFLFAALHLDFARIPSITLIGIVLGYMAFRSGSVLPAIVMHGSANFLGTVFGFVSLPVNPMQMGMTELAMIAGGCLVVGSLLLVAFAKVNGKAQELPEDATAPQPWKSVVFWMCVLIPLVISLMPYFTMPMPH